HLDGVSIVPLLKQTGTVDRDAIYWHYPHYGNQGGAPGGAIRQGDWKLIEWYEDGRVELFDLEGDIGEQQDLAAKHPEKVAELRAKLNAWRTTAGVRMPSVNPNYDPRGPDGRAPGGGVQKGKAKGAGKGGKKAKKG
ncbi:MAG: sulfatase/phosphatase domain-containing protein, partial [Planctomycetota bacterium]